MLVAKGALEYDKTSSDASNTAMDASAVQYRRFVASQTVPQTISVPGVRGCKGRLPYGEFIDLSLMNCDQVPKGADVACGASVME